MTGFAEHAIAGNLRPAGKLLDFAKFCSSEAERSKRRLAKFLDAAAKLLAEIGFEAATMTNYHRAKEISALN